MIQIYFTTQLPRIFLKISHSPVPSVYKCPNLHPPKKIFKGEIYTSLEKTPHNYKGFNMKENDIAYILHVAQSGNMVQLSVKGLI